MSYLLLLSYRVFVTLIHKKIQFQRSFKICTISISRLEVRHKNEYRYKNV